MSETKMSRGALKGSVSPVGPEPAPVDVPTLDFYVFVSFDLTNSTAFKHAVDNWPDVVADFYRLVDIHFRERANARTWKYAGDEVLLYVPVSSRAQLRDVVTLAHDAMFQCTTELRRDRASSFRQLGLNIKCTAWMDAVIDMEIAGPERLRFNPTRAIRTRSAQAVGVEDFVGPAIDAGFRVSKFAHYGVVALSAELAYLLIAWRPRPEEDEGLTRPIRIVAHERLKGVWAGRLYPVVWYSTDWREAPAWFSHEERVSGDSAYTWACDQQSRHSCNGEGRWTEKSALRLALDENGRGGFLDSVQLPDTAQQPAPRAPLPALDVHVVAVCVDQEDRVMLAKRLDTREVAGGCWEMGCAHVAAGESFKQAVARHYHDVFGLHLDDWRGPIADYFIDEREVNGVIYAARATGDPPPHTMKHSEVRWMSRDEIEELGADEVVDKLHENVRQALRALSERDDG